jgi:hypothetical protein
VIFTFRKFPVSSFLFPSSPKWIPNRQFLDPLAVLHILAVQRVASGLHSRRNHQRIAEKIIDWPGSRAPARLGSAVKSHLGKIAGASETGAYLLTHLVHLVEERNNSPGGAAAKNIEYTGESWQQAKRR